MQDLTFATIRPYIIGERGRHWPEYGGADRVFLHGIFRREARSLGISPLSAEKYVRGATRFPRRLRQIYTTPDGVALICANLVDMISDCPCVSHLLEVQDGVYEMLCNCDLQQDIYAQLTSLYVSDQPTTNDIARFLSAVLHYAILAS